MRSSDIVEGDGDGGISSILSCLSLNNSQSTSIIPNADIIPDISIIPAISISTFLHKRKGRMCAFCKSNSSLRKCKRCNEFNKRKNELSPTSYIKSSLDPTEEAGFCAGGIIPYCIDSNDCKHFLLLREKRGKKYALNFAAGGRESTIELDNSSQLVPETSEETAKAEFIEEVGKLIGNESEFIKEVYHAKLTKVYWDSTSKCAIFPVKVNFDLLGLTMQDNPDLSEANNFVIVTNETLSLHAQHRFIKSIFKSIRELCGSIDEFLHC
jgi:8-oxo-dGTP pyrophosphatase MutT (NUDIX family)